jgi:hypothetical protein
MNGFTAEDTEVAEIGVEMRSTGKRDGDGYLLLLCGLCDLGG